MKNTQTSLVNIETSAFSRDLLSSTIKDLEKNKQIEPDLILLKKTYREIFDLLSILDANPKAKELLFDFVSEYRKSKRYPLSYKGFRSWSKSKEEKEKRLLGRFKRKINGVFAAYTLLCRIKHKLQETK